MDDRSGADSVTATLGGVTGPASPPRSSFIAPEGPHDAGAPFQRCVRDALLALAAAEPGRFAVADAAAASVRSSVRAGVGRLVGAPNEPIRPVVRIQR